MTYKYSCARFDTLRPFDTLKALQAQGPRTHQPGSETKLDELAIELVKRPGWGTKAEVTSGFVSMFRQAQHMAGPTN